MADKVRVVETPLRSQRCQTCAHFADEVFGQLPPTCRINPVGLMVTQAGIAGTWPPTRATYWCSHWKALPSNGSESVTISGVSAKS